jgi:hypothetical protein
MPQGRPRSLRFAGTGEKLYMALKLSGLSWGTRGEAEQFTRSRRWLDCGLPRSINTVLEDIRSGMAAERLDRYAGYFKVAAQVFLDTSVGAYSPDFSCQILKGRHDSRAVSPFELGRGAVSLELLNRQNDARYLNDLQGVLGGLYDMIVRTEPAASWLLGAAIIGDAAEDGLQAVGVLALPDAHVDFVGRIFRWHNYLHVHYASTDNQLLGYMMTPDPLQSIVVRHRRPFFMKLAALAGNLVPAAQPDRSTIYVLRREQGGLDYNDLRQEAICRPYLGPDHPRYVAIMDMLSRDAASLAEAGGLPAAS